MDHLFSNNEMTQNQIWSENPHDNIHNIWELPNLEGIFFM